jgi:hypothetical protein
VSGDRGRHRCVSVTFPASAAFFWSAAAGIPAGCWGTTLRETAGPRRQSDGATLGCCAFPRLTRRSPQHSRATPAGGVHGALRPVCGMGRERSGSPIAARCRRASHTPLWVLSGFCGAFIT